MLNVVAEKSRLARNDLTSGFIFTSDFSTVQNCTVLSYFVLEDKISTYKFCVLEHLTTDPEPPGLVTSCDRLRRHASSLPSQGPSPTQLKIGLPASRCLLDWGKECSCRPVWNDPLGLVLQAGFALCWVGARRVLRN